MEEPLVSPTPHPTLQHSRPKSTYGNRSLSSANAVGQSQLDQNRDWVPKIVLVDSKKFELGCENESGSISADQSVMDYVNVGDTVMIELPVDGELHVHRIDFSVREIYREELQYIFLHNIR